MPLYDMLAYQHVMTLFEKPLNSGELSDRSSALQLISTTLTLCSLHWAAHGLHGRPMGHLVSTAAVAVQPAGVLTFSTTTCKQLLSS